MLDHERASRRRLKLVVEAEEMRTQGRVQRAVGDLDRLDGLRRSAQAAGQRSSADKRFLRRRRERERAGVVARRLPAPARRRSARCGSRRGASLASASASVRPTKPPPAITTSKRSRPLALASAMVQQCHVPRRRVNLLKGGLGHAKVSPMSRALETASVHPRPRTARGESLPRLEPAGRLAARVRRPGDRPGAGRGASHGERAARAFAARLFPARRRSRRADHLRGRSHPRRRQLLDPPRGGDPARPGDLLHGRLVPQAGAGPRSTR